MNIFSKILRVYFNFGFGINWKVYLVSIISLFFLNYYMSRFFLHRIEMICSNDITLVLFYAYIIPMNWSLFALDSKRLEDGGINGWIALLFFPLCCLMPSLQFIYPFVLACIPTRFSEGESSARYT